MDALDAVHGLQFHWHTSLHEQVQPVSAIQVPAGVLNRHRFLALDLYASLREFMDQARFIRGLEQARPQCAMNCHRGTDDRFRNLV